MELKYQKNIDEFENCESSNCKASQRNAYRWVFEDINDERNFLPRYLLKPDLKNKNPRCTGYSLSMFDEAEQAKLRLRYICKDKKLLYKVLGTHLGSGELTLEQGISNESSKNKDNLGHFEFFECVAVDLSKTFTIIERIEEND